MPGRPGLKRRIPSIPLLRVTVGTYHGGRSRCYCEPPWYTVELRTALQGPTMGSRLSAIDRRQSLVAGTVFSGGCFFLL